VEDGSHDERVITRANQLHLDVYAHGAYSAPISLETRERTTARVGTQREENRMSTRLSPIAGYGAGSLGIRFHCLAVKGSGVHILSAPHASEILEAPVGQPPLSCGRSSLRRVASPRGHHSPWSTIPGEQRVLHPVSLCGGWEVLWQRCSVLRREPGTADADGPNTSQPM
jgi:hypothetical protein